MHVKLDTRTTLDRDAADVLDLAHSTHSGEGPSRDVWFAACEWADVMDYDHNRKYATYRRALVLAGLS